MKIFNKTETKDSNGDFQEMVLYHIKQMQQCLFMAGKLFSDNEENKIVSKCGRDVLESVILKECVGCLEYQKCQFTIADKDKLGNIIEKQGGLSYDDLKRCHPCKNGQDFIEEANQIYERELFMRGMKHQMIQMRSIIGKQYMEAGKLLGDFFDRKMSYTQRNQRLYEKIKKEFEKYHLKIFDVYFYENPQKGRQVYLYLKKKRGNEVRTRQIAILLSQILKEKMVPLSWQKNIVKNGCEIYGFTPAEKFYVIGGIRTRSFEDEQKNGDCFSMGKVREGAYAAMISDGMGTGDRANEESKKMIEMLEEMLEVGIEEEICIQLLKTALLFQIEKERYATLDFFQLDLFAGIGSFFKMGACPCLLKRKGKVEIIESKAAAISMTSFQADTPIYRKKMESEDLLVMFSDGVLDCMPESENKLDKLQHFLEEINVIRPQAAADALYEKITGMEGYKKRDDITILVLGIWDRY